MKTRTISHTLLAVSALALAFCLALAGCGGASGDAAATGSADGSAAGEAVASNDSFEGFWMLDSGSAGGNDLSKDSVNTMKEYGLSLMLRLNADGTGAMSMYGAEVPLTWEKTSDTEASFNVALSDDAAKSDADKSESADKSEAAEGDQLFDTSAYEGDWPVKLADGKLVMGDDKNSMVFSASTQEEWDKLGDSSGLMSLFENMQSLVADDENASDAGSASDAEATN